jgi:hypothetical protein
LLGLITYAYTSLTSSSRQNAMIQREKMYGEVMESRRKLGMEGREEDPVKWREKRKMKVAESESQIAAGSEAPKGV